MVKNTLRIKLINNKICRKTLKIHVNIDILNKVKIKKDALHKKANTKKGIKYE